MVVIISFLIRIVNTLVGIPTYGTFVLLVLLAPEPQRAMNSTLVNFSSSALHLCNTKLTNSSPKQF